jgi:hypothetical protein
MALSGAVVFGGGVAIAAPFSFHVWRSGMARKPNYGQNRADVNRAKQARKEAKLEALKEAVARRKAGDDPQDAESDTEKDLKTEGEHHGQ